MLVSHLVSPVDLVRIVSCDHEGMICTSLSGSAHPQILAFVFSCNTMWSPITDGSRRIGCAAAPPHMKSSSADANIFNSRFIVIPLP